MRSADGCKSLSDNDGLPRIGILVVAYNAESTLRATLDRVPVGFRERIAEVIVLDDASHDDTFAHGKAWAERPDTPRTLVVRHTKNLGYGGNQKAAYKLALERGLDIVVLLHGDGQYAPELLPEMVAPLERGECDAVMGSRMMDKGAARRGGMPFYKLVGNRILTHVENALLGTELTEFHSGYRAYSTKALLDIPFEHNTDDFDFDTQIIVQLIHAGKWTGNSDSTYYGDEIRYVNGMRYAKDVVKDALSIVWCLWDSGPRNGCPSHRTMRSRTVTDLARGNPGKAGRTAGGPHPRPRLFRWPLRGPRPGRRSRGDRRRPHGNPGRARTHRPLRQGQPRRGHPG